MRRALVLRVLRATPNGGYKDFTRTTTFAANPRVGDTVFIDPLEAQSRKIIAREWGYSGGLTVRLATITGNSDNDPNEGAEIVEALLRDGWERDIVIPEG